MISNLFLHSNLSFEHGHAPWSSSSCRHMAVMLAFAGEVSVWAICVAAVMSAFPQAVSVC